MLNVFTKTGFLPADLMKKIVCVGYSSVEDILLSCSCDSRCCRFVLCCRYCMLYNVSVDVLVVVVYFIMFL